MNLWKRTFIIILITVVYGLWSMAYSCFATEIKEPNVAGAFYPADKGTLSARIKSFLKQAKAGTLKGDIFSIIVPHAGYDFSGQVAACAYKLVENKPYKTVVIIGPSHYFGFQGVAVYPSGNFRTPLGDVEVDKDFTAQLLAASPEIFFEPQAFAKEHSVEVQIPFLQETLSEFKIVPIVMGFCDFSLCQKLAEALKEAIGKRQDVLVVVSTDMYHGYDYTEADIVDNLTISYLKNLDSLALYNGLVGGKLQLCGGFPVVAAFILAKESGHRKIMLLKHNNSS